MKLKKGIAGLLSVLLCSMSLIGCGPADTSAPPDRLGMNMQTQKGGYVEEKISQTEDSCIGIFARRDGVHYFTQKNYTGPLLQQGIAWNRYQDGSWTSGSEMGLAEIDAVVGKSWDMIMPKPYLAENGTLYWKITAMQKKEATDFWFSVQDGAVTQLPNAPEGVPGLALSEDTSTLTLCGEGVLRSNPSCQLEAFDMQGQPVQMTLPELGYSKLLGGNVGGYYLLTPEKKVVHYVPNGTTAELLFDGSWFHLSDSEKSVRFSVVDAADTVYLSLDNHAEEGPHSDLYRYYWDPELVVQTRETLTVFSLYPSDTIESAAIAMQKKYNVPVEYQSALEVTEDQKGVHITGSRTDALTQLNAKLLAGDGPDVLILDDMPLDSMTEKGVLLDLTGLVSTEGLLQNVTEFYDTKAGLYALPVRVQPILMGGTQDELAPLRSAEVLAQQLAAGPALIATDQNAVDVELPLLAPWNTAQLFDLFYPVYASSIWENGMLNEAAYRDFMEMLGAIYTGSGCNLYLEKAGRAYHTYYQHSNTTGNNYMNGNSKIFCDQVDAVWRIGNYLAEHARCMDEKPVGVLQPLTTKSGHTSLTPVCVTGINASTTHPEAAAQFLQLLLSEDLQADHTDEGFPVRVDTITALWNDSKKSPGLKFKSDTDLAAIVEQMEITVQQTILHDAAGAGVDVWLETKSTDQAVKAAQQAVQLWLAEQ